MAATGSAGDEPPAGTGGAGEEGLASAGTHAPRGRASAHALAGAGGQAPGIAGAVGVGGQPVETLTRTEVGQNSIFPLHLIRLSVHTNGSAR